MGRNVKRSNILLLFALLVASAPISASNATTTTGVGSARASAIPLRISLGGVSADLLDISLSATTDPERAGTTSRSASARMTALRVGGPQPLTAGELQSAAEDGQSSEDNDENDPLEAPGIVLATLQSAAAAASVDDDGSRASAGATLIDFSLGGGLIHAETLTSEMTVEATAAGVTSTKILDLPSVSALRVGDLAEAAGVLLSSLTVEELLVIANTLVLGGSGEFGDLLAQEQDQSNQLDAAQTALDEALAAQSQAQASLDAATAALADAQAQLVSDEAVVDAANAAVDAALVAVADAESAVAAAQASLDDASADLQTLQSLTLLTPGAIDTLQSLATKYAVPGAVTSLNFLTMLADVTAAVEAAVDDATAALADAQADLDAANGALATAQAAQSAAEAALATTQDTVDDLEAEITSLNDSLTSLAADISSLDATIASLESALDTTIADLAAFTEDLRTIVGDASIINFEGVHIVVHVTATADGGVPDVDVSFDRLSIGTVPAAQDVSTTEAAITLLPKIADAVNGVGAVLGLPPMDVGVLESDSSSGTDADGYRYASASFTLLTVSVPTPDGETLTLSLGDPEVFAEFAPSSSGCGASCGGGGCGTCGGGGGGGSGSDPLGEVAPNSDNGMLPITGVERSLVPGLATITCALAMGASLRRRSRRPS
jgi:hypothetical protein